MYSPNVLILLNILLLVSVATFIVVVQVPSGAYVIGNYAWQSKSSHDDNNNNYNNNIPSSFRSGSDDNLQYDHNSELLFGGKEELKVGREVAEQQQLQEQQEIQTQRE